MGCCGMGSQRYNAGTSDLEVDIVDLHWYWIPWNTVWVDATATRGGGAARY